MSILIHLILRLFAVVALCLACATSWVMLDAHRSIERAAEASADRTARHLEGLYWQQLLWRGGMRQQALLPLPDWQTLKTLNVLAPGVCVTVAALQSDATRLCSQVEAVGPAAPAWFAAVEHRLFKPYEVVRRQISQRDPDSGSVLVEPDREAALRQMWSQVSIVVGAAAVMALGIAALAAVMIGHTLKPARSIIAGLQELERGNLGPRLPRFKVIELNHIAQAVNHLAHKLAATEASRVALTARLLEAQEDERRAIARDLHDEFGQGLTATLALANLIESEARGQHQGIATDARKIGEVQMHLVETLRGTLHRLRAQNIDEVGLEASLRQLVADCNARSGAKTVFRLSLAAPAAEQSSRFAIDLYRIAQECLTNASRHGHPSEVCLSVDRGPSRSILLTVEDNGGGDPASVDSRAGLGIRGIRERLAALGGQLIISPAAHGVRVTAMIPQFEDRLNVGRSAVPA